MVLLLFLYFSVPFHDVSAVFLLSFLCGPGVVLIVLAFPVGGDGIGVLFGHHLAVVHPADCLILLSRYLFGVGHNRVQLVLLLLVRPKGLVFVGFVSGVGEHADEQIVGDIAGVGLFEVVADDAAIWGLDCAVGIFAVGTVPVLQFG